MDLTRPGEQPASAGEEELTVQIVVPGWAPLSAAIWLGLTPRPRRAPGELRVARLEFERRVDHPDHPPPAEAEDRLRSLWAQPLTLWGATVTPEGGSMLVLDAGVGGFWCVRREEDAYGGTVILSPVGSSQVWRDLLRLLSEAGLFDRQGPRQGR